MYKGTKESWQCDRRDFIGEAVFIPKQVQSEEREEDDAYLIAAIYRSEFRRVEFAIFDSKHIEQGPLCRIRSPQPFPYGFHGSFTENVFVA